MIVQQLVVKGLLRVTTKFTIEFDQNTNDKPSSRNIPKADRDSTATSQHYKSAHCESKPLIRQAVDNIAVQLLRLIDVGLYKMAATGITSGCMHSSVQSRPVRCAVHTANSPRQTSRSSAACCGMTRPNTKKFLQGWFPKSFCSCSYVKLASAVTVKL